MQKGQTQVLILAGAVLLLVLAGGIFYLGRVSAPKPQTPVATPQPSPLSTEAPAKVEDPTANWKTYTSTKYGYLLRYPNEWNLEDKGSLDANTFNTIAWSFTEDSNTLTTFELTVSKRSYEIELEIAGNNVGGEVKNKFVAGISGKEFGPGVTLGGKQALVVVIPKNQDMTYRFSLYGKDISKVINSFNQILSTFKFLD